MTRFLPKLAVASAVATACSFAGASVLSFTADTNGGASKAAGSAGTPLSLEASRTTSSTATTFFTLGAVQIVTERTHFAGDEWQLTVSNGRFESYGAATAVLAAPVLSCNDGNNANPISFDAAYSGGGRGSDASTLKWTVSAAGTSNNRTSSGQTCTISNLRLLQSGASAEGSVALSFQSLRTNGSLNDASQAAVANRVVTSVVTQVGTISVGTALNGVVDFQNSLGLGFASDDNTADTPKQDGLTFTFAKSTNNTSNSISTGMSVTFSYTAPAGSSFSWLDANGDGICGLHAGGTETTTANGRITGDFAATINAACTTLTFESNAIAVPNNTSGNSTATIYFGSRSAEPSAGNGTTITAFDWNTISTMTARISTASIMTNSGALDLGEWTSNGSQVVIPYMPFNSAGATKIEPVVYITNRSGVTAPATATIRDANGVKCDVTLGSIAATRTVNVSTLLSDAIKTCYNTTTAAAEAGHRLYIVINASLPSSTTDVYSGFTVGGSSRVSVVNSSNGAK